MSYENSIPAPATVQLPATGICGLLTHSRMACFRTCPRKHYLRYELGLVPATDDAPRRIGSAFHALLEAADKGIDQTTMLTGMDPYEVETVTAMFDGHLRYQFEDEKAVTVIASELEFNIPLRNPDTGRETQTWRFAGKIDRIVKLRDGRLAIMEYKTTSRDFSPGADYWQNLHMDSQLSMYVIAARELGYNVETVLYDVTRRPALRPYKATPAESRKYTKDGKLYANQRAEDEDPVEFGDRIRIDIAERPGHYFARIEIARLEQDLEDCKAEIWQQQQVIREAQKTGRWYRNPNSCYGVTPCDYLPVCLNRSLEQYTPAGFVRSASIHPELANEASA